MKRLLLLMAAALLAGGLLIGELARDSGYILVSIYGYSLETSVWFAVIFLVLTTVITWYSLKILFSILGGVMGATRYVVQGSDEQHRKQLAAGLVDFMEGNWKQARKQLLKTANRSMVPVINYLAAARSAYELGDRDEAQQLLAKAETVGGQHKLATALAQARMELMDQRYEQCIAALERVHEETPHHPVVLDMLRQCYMALEDWADLEALLPTLKKYKPMGDAQLQDIELRCWSHKLRTAADSANGNPVDVLAEVWNKLDKRAQRLPALILVYVDLLIKYNAQATAESILRKALNKDWDDSLLDSYGRLSGDDVARQLITAESWLKERPRNATLLLALGRIALRNQLWGKAREYFEASANILPQPETYAELARLTAALGEHQLSTDYYQRGLSMITHNLPELPAPKADKKFGQQ